ncbi:COG4280 domain-containing protein [Chlorogloea sp. CCALA 695]|uniref:COG4280 domain-containing protein n=1 Tax=Chlorogloea sp. CCALA 695 TaxID=2107693 RepID=UPI000D054674|nr:COG4280 domain-containing protein [Chlorogloea sp. CCALA 695]PSB31350.1 hypothetical protein C7B70_13540 [Chlorogloea sp. CCALA 695]
MNWEIFLASFTGSLIELLEILGVAIVVGRVTGWRNALVGSGIGIGVTVIAALILGKSLILIPIQILEIIAGAVLLAFGQKWTRSVVKYYGGILKPKDDEDEQLQKELEQEGIKSGWNWFAVVATFKSALLESVEIAIAIVTLGVTAGKWYEAIGGTSLAAIGLVCFAFLFRVPLNQVPIKPMKFVAAMLLMGFGTYWLGEGLNVRWSTGSWTIIWLPLIWGSFMAGCAALLRWRIMLQKQQEIIG